MSGLLATVWAAFGTVAGLTAALALVLVGVVHLPPWIERLRERAEGPPPSETAAPSGGNYGILVSDLHLDTWDYEKGETHLAFAAFLDWARRHPRIADLYVNGDLLDVPPHPLNQPDVTTLRVRDGGSPDLERGELGVLQNRFEPLLEAMGSLAAHDDVPPLRITYLTGNHDVGISGLRYVRPNLAWTSFKILWNPSIRVEAAPGREVYVEHGHRVDPYLWLYLRYAALELMRGPMLREVQRSGRIGIGPNAHVAGELPLDARAPQPWETAAPEIPAPQGEDAASARARYRYRAAARRLFRELPPSVRTVTMGHTHIPDRYTFPDGRVYLNSGDWAGNTPHRAFLVIHPDGRVTGPHQWRNPEEAERELGR